MLQGPGENAGVVDLGEGEAVAFKVESHNHPSAVEPFQGAATGVGGILRDVVAMGARPVALLDGLRFGRAGLRVRTRGRRDRPLRELRRRPHCRRRHVLRRRVRRRTRSSTRCASGSCPRSASCALARARPGDLVVLYGATTGRDGIGGASVLASQELSDEDDDKRPTVQIGDPFTGKKLIEASLELVEDGLVEGAAGPRRGRARLLARRDGGPWRASGIDVHLDRVPLREPDLDPVEIVISESQERMVCVTDRLESVGAVCKKWELNVAEIGEVTDSGVAAAVLRRRGRRGDPGRAPDRRGAALPRADPAAAAGGADSSTRVSRPAQTSCSTCSPRPTSAAAGSDLSPVRPSGRVPNAPASGPGRGRPAPAALDARARSLARRRRSPGLARSARGWRSRGRSGGGAQRRLRWRTAARRHRLSQLRQSREARGRLGALRGDRGHGPRLRGARDPGRLRQRLALQRDGRARDLADSGRGLHRARRGRAARPRTWREGDDDLRRRGARALASTGPSTRRSSSAAPPGDRRRPSCRPKRRWSRSSGARRRRLSAHDTAARAAWRSRSPSWPLRPASGRGSSSTRDALTWFGEGGGQAVVSLLRRRCFCARQRSSPTHGRRRRGHAARDPACRPRGRLRRGSPDVRRSSASTLPSAMSRVSPTSASSPSSTAGRSLRGSPSPTAVA